MKNENGSKKKNGITAVVVMLLVALVTTGVMSIFTKGFKDFGVFKKIKDDIIPPKVELPLNGGDGENTVLGDVLDDNGNDMHSNNVYPMKSNMLFTKTTADSAQANEGIIIKAILTPANALNQKVDWSFYWVDPRSEFAKGKNVVDYFNLSPTDDGALTANIKCLQPFGEQIKIKVVARDNVFAFAECAVNYSTTPRVDFIDIINFQTNKSYTKVDDKNVEVNFFNFENDKIVLNTNFGISSVGIRLSSQQVFVKISDELNALDGVGFFTDWYRCERTFPTNLPDESRIRFNSIFNVVGIIHSLCTNSQSLLNDRIYKILNSTMTSDVQIKIVSNFVSEKFGDPSLDRTVTNIFNMNLTYADIKVDTIKLTDGSVEF